MGKEDLAMQTRFSTAYQTAVIFGADGKWSEEEVKIILGKVDQNKPGKAYYVPDDLKALALLTDPSYRTLDSMTKGYSINYRYGTDFDGCIVYDNVLERYLLDKFLRRHEKLTDATKLFITSEGIAYEASLSKKSSDSFNRLNRAKTYFDKEVPLLLEKAGAIESLKPIFGIGFFLLGSLGTLGLSHAYTKHVFSESLITFLKSSGVLRRPQFILLGGFLLVGATLAAYGLDRALNDGRLMQWVWEGVSGY